MKKTNRFFAAAILILCGTLIAAAQTVTSVKIAVSTKPTVPVTDGKLAVGGSRTYVAIVEPEEAKTLPVTWTVSDLKLMSLDKVTPGKVRGMAPGKVTVTAEVGGVKADCVVEVVQKDAKVGDYFFDNGTWESGGIVDGKKCIGVIFYVDPADKQKGKIVSLDETVEKKWSTQSIEQPGATSEFDGLANLTAIKAVADWKNIFEAEAWCAGKTDGGLQWYLPAVAELRQLFAASCGLTWVASGADESKKEINDWTELNVTMRPADPDDVSEEKTNPYPAAREAFNKKFTNIGATALNASGTLRYMSSTEYESDFCKMLSFEGGFCIVYPRHMFFDNIRAIACFPKDEGSSSIKNVYGNGTTAKATVYPNPAVSTARIEAGVKINSVNVYSVTGALTGATAAIDNTGATVNVEGLAPGTYIAIIEAANGKRLSAKIIKR